MIYRYSDSNFHRNDQMKSKLSCDARIPEHGEKGTVIKIIYQNGSNGIYDLDDILVGRGDVVMGFHVQQEIVGIVMIAIMFFLSFVALITGIYLKHFKLNSTRFLNIAAFLALSGIWFLSDSALAQEYTSFPALTGMISFYAFMLMSVPMLHFIQNTVSKENQWIPEIWILLFYGNAIGQGIVNIWFAVPFKNMLFVTHLILFTGVAAMAILLWREYQKHQTQELELCLKAFGVLGISGVIALALYWMYAIYWYDALFQFGILLFISFLFWGLLCKVSNDIQYRMEQAVYERMSIEDRMTGMKNRKAFEQQLDQLQQDVMLLENALLIFIDIANLKTINDTYGMQIGDEAVIRTARSIQAAESAACEQHTECFRIAGDEFAIVVTRPQKTPEEWKQMIRNEMKKEFGGRYPVQLAFGCSYLRKADGTRLSISDWKMQADRMMFSHK